MSIPEDLAPMFRLESVEPSAASTDTSIIPKFKDEPNEAGDNNVPDAETSKIVHHDSSIANNICVSGNLILDSSTIKMVPLDEQEDELKALGLTVYNQTDFEEGVLLQVDQAFKKLEDERQMRMALTTLQSVEDDIRSVKLRIKQIDKILNSVSEENLINKEAKRKLESVKKEKENKQNQLRTLQAKQRALAARVERTDDLGAEENELDDELDPETKWQLEKVFGIGGAAASETEKERLIRTGQMTPFGTLAGTSAPTTPHIIVSSEMTDFERFLMNQDVVHQKKSKMKPQTLVKKNIRCDAVIAQGCPKLNDIPSERHHKSASKPSSKQNSMAVSSDSEFEAQPSTSRDHPPLLPHKKKKSQPKESLGTVTEGEYHNGRKLMRKSTFHRWNMENQVIDFEEVDPDEASGSEYFPSGDSDDAENQPTVMQKKKSPSKRKGKKASVCRKRRGDDSSSVDSEAEVDQCVKSRRRKLIDDGNLDDYLKRIRAWRKMRLEQKHEKLDKKCSDEGFSEPESDEFEELDENYKIPLILWKKIYKYQQTCVQWLWELHSQKCGGIIGDEMGLGKTIQVIAYLVGLRSSSAQVTKERKDGPVLIVTPTTIMYQWVKEFHTWWPPFRVAILHESGSYTGTKESLIRNIHESNGVLVTSYSGVVIHLTSLKRFKWHYIILDEGHKIRNPDARITLACKQFSTPHRLILSGTPVQNNLKELWSLFDFIYPGKLGTLPVFMQQFSVPISHGGYSNASQVQVQTAYKCALVLRDTINPYLLRRMKADVKMNVALPNKSEQVLFCQLSDIQRELYQGYLDSKEIKSILDGRLQVFVGLINLRKICNHPDLYSGGPKIFGNVDTTKLPEDMRYGYWKRSGKMLVIDSLLTLWYKQGHRVLLFSQSKQMLDILEYFVKLRDLSYLRMDGSTSISSRQPLVSKFNSDPSVFVFLLTTRVGGLGVNLTGANRVVIYDPDWNPSTDAQARERAWRIGQQRHVTCYRLLTAGTIEEKIYHRQIFKQFLTNRVLKDPRQRRFFKSNDLFELFTLQDDSSRSVETGTIFAGTGSEVVVKPQLEKGSEINRKDGSRENGVASCLSNDKIRKMKELAKKLSQRIGENHGVISSHQSEVVNGDIDIESKLVPTVSKSESKNILDNVCNSHRKKKKRKRQRVMVDGECINNLVKLDVARPYDSDEERLNSMKQDEYVLQRLFAKSKVHAALKHDAIMDAGDPDYALVEGEAERVAREAVKTLKKSRRLCFRAETGIPTWTGNSGVLGSTSAVSTPKPRFGQKKKIVASTTIVENASSKEASPSKSNALFGKKRHFDGQTTPEDTSSVPVSSSQLLSKIRERNAGINTPCASDEESSNPTQNNVTEYDELLVDLRNFIAFQAATDGQATTEELLTVFKHKLPPQDSAVFKALLNKICTFNRSSSGDGFWHLKHEFR